MSTVFTNDNLNSIISLHGIIYSFNILKGRIFSINSSSHYKLMSVSYTHLITVGYLTRPISLAIGLL